MAKKVDNKEVKKVVKKTPTKKVVKEGTQFKKGTPKPPNSGRKKGTPNKRTVQQREAFEVIMQKVEERLMNSDALDDLSITRLAELYTNLLRFKKPQLSAIKSENDTKVSGDINVTIKMED